MKGSKFTLLEAYVIDIVSDSYLASMEAGNDYTALRLLPRPSMGYDLSHGTSLAKFRHSKNSNLY